jgi:hypothetical protein
MIFIQKKKIGWIAFSLFLSLALLSFAESTGQYRRQSTAVDDVFEPYTSEEWIISPDDEEIENPNTDGISEYDIDGVISCYDEDYLRFDILLYDSISYEYDSFYALKIDYGTLTEFYTYYTLSGKLIYEKQKNGAITERKNLTGTDSDDCAGIASSGLYPDDDIYFILNKEDHIKGEKEKRYYVTLTCYSGYLKDEKSLQITDDTDAVDVEFQF